MLLETFLPEWLHTKVKALSDIEEVYFYHTTKPIVIGKRKVLLKNVTGTFHPDYNKETWAYMLSNLKRVKRFSCIQEVRELAENSYDEICYSKFGREYLIGGGNHRTSILKFYGDDYIDAVITEFTFDYELFFCHEMLLKSGFIINRNNEYPTPNTIFWNVFIPNIEISLKGKGEIYRFKSFYNSLRTDWISIIKYWWQSGSISNTDYRHKYFSFGRLHELKYELAKFKRKNFKS